MYLEKPEIKVPDKKPGRGRPPHVSQPVGNPIRLDKYNRALNENDWEEVKVRKTAKEWLKLKVHKVEIWVWNRENNMLKRRTLIISQTIEKKPRVKYS